MFYEAVDGLNELGICSEQRMPYAGEPDPNRKPSSEAVAEARALQALAGASIKRWSVDCPLNEHQLLEIKRAWPKGIPWPVVCAGRKL